MASNLFDGSILVDSIVEESLKIVLGIVAIQASGLEQGQAIGRDAQILNDGLRCSRFNGRKTERLALSSQTFVVFELNFRYD